MPEHRKKSKIAATLPFGLNRFRFEAMRDKGSLKHLSFWSVRSRFTYRNEWSARFPFSVDMFHVVHSFADNNLKTVPVRQKRSNTLIKIQIVLPVKIRCAHKVLAQGAIRFRINVYIYHHNGRKELWKLEGHTWTSSTEERRKKITRKKNTYTKKSRKREKKNRLTMHSAHCTGYKGNEQNEHIHKNLFSSSIYVFFAFLYNCFLFICSNLQYNISALFLTFWNWSQFVWQSRKESSCASFFVLHFQFYH